MIILQQNNYLYSVLYFLFTQLLWCFHRNNFNSFCSLRGSVATIVFYNYWWWFYLYLVYFSFFIFVSFVRKTPSLYTNKISALFWSFIFSLYWLQSRLLSFHSFISLCCLFLVSIVWADYLYYWYL